MKLDPYLLPYKINHNFISGSKYEGQKINMILNEKYIK
jgi:hypothetical protein